MGPGGYKTKSNHTKNKLPYSTWYDRAYARQVSDFICDTSHGKRDRVPVSLLEPKSSVSNFSKWSNSAGMRPGEYKTQSKHTTSKSTYPTGTKGREECQPIPSCRIQVRG